MSNRPNRNRRPGAVPSTEQDDRRRNLLLIAGLVVVVVIIGVLVALGGAEDDEEVSTDAPDFGPVAVEGTPLPELADGGADPAVGMAAPVIEGTDPEGSGVSVGGSGEPTLVAFLAHWCPHCQNEVPVIVDLMEEGELDGVRVVGVLTGTNPDAPNHPPVAWMEREGWEGELLLDDDRFSAGAAYGLSGYPFVVYLDGDGEVVSRTSGGVGRDGILQRVEELRAAG